MKTVMLGLVVLLGHFNALTQDCSNYYFFQNNKTIEMTIYDKRGPSGKQVYTVSDVKNAGTSTTASLQSEMFDKKGKSLAKASSAMVCSGGALLIDMKMIMPQQQAQQFNQTDAKADNVYIEYPSNMNVGDNLKDGNMDLAIDNNGMKQSVKLVISNRKIEAKESVTTPAGTWDCFRISYNGKLHIRTMGIGIPVNMDGTEWFAPGFGVVKTESKHGGTAITAIK